MTCLLVTLIEYSWSCIESTNLAYCFSEKKLKALHHNNDLNINLMN